MTKKPTLLGSIKAKLISATCMLLVAVIMVVSSTYAWFTLSTAPEVTGITTAVGANGALEMALLPANGDASGVNTATGTLDTIAANRTWGNLVDLSDASYGLDKIVLYPSQLNLVEGVLGEGTSAFLQVPVYGEDGRVQTMSNKTSTGVLSNGQFFPSGEKGVRGVGSASGMTPRQLAYRNAVAAIGTNMRKAQQIAAASMNANGGDIAQIAITHATAANGADTYTVEDATKLLGVVTELEKSVAALEDAYKQALLAYTASRLVTGDNAESAHEVVAGYISSNMTLADMITQIKSLASVSVLPVDTYVTKLNDTKANIATARSGLQAAIDAGGDLTWSQIGTPMGELVNTDKMTVNGVLVSDFKSKVDEIAGAALAGGGLQLVVYSGGGVFADIADHCGNYQASILIKEVNYSGLTLTNATARMKTEIRGEWTWKDTATDEQKNDATNIGKTDLGSYATLTPYLEEVTDTLSGNEPVRADGVNLPMTEFYGYIIDMVFRTNAADSDLLLQIDGTDRIYEGNNNAETMGHGSSMTFASTDANFSAEAMKNLMKCIRIVFFDTVGQTILATAKLDVDRATYGTDGWTAKMYLYEMDGEDEVVLSQDNSVITALTQNVATSVSALVYLDGTTIQNKDVSIGKTSMTGKMNLQFSSSATLVPMEYADLHTATQYNVTVPTGVTGEEKATAKTAYSFTVQDGYTLSAITVNGAALTAGTDYTANGTTYTIAAEKVTGAIVIAVTSNP